MPAPTDLAALGVQAPPGYRIRRVGWLDPAAQQLVAAQQEEIAVRYAGERPPHHAWPELEFLDVVDVALLERWSPAGASDPVGCGALVERDGTVEARRIYVTPAHRGQRLGSTILVALEALAAIHGNTELVLATSSRQPEAVAMSAATGWERRSDHGLYRDVPGVACFVRDLTLADHGNARPQLTIKSRRAARAIVVDADQRILMTENHLNGRIHWGLPGGGIDAAESAAEAACRELAEETGLTGVQLDGPVAQREYFDDFPDVVLHQREQIFWGRSASTNVTLAGVSADEAYLAGLRWWAPDELAANPDQVHPSRVLELLAVLLDQGTPAHPLSLSSAADSLSLR